MLRNLLDQYIIIYLNDILVYSKILKEHRQYVIKVLTYFVIVDLKLEPKKYEFYRKIVDFLGYVIIIEGIKADLKKIRVLLEWPVPINVKEL